MLEQDFAIEGHETLPYTHGNFYALRTRERYVYAQWERSVLVSCNIDAHFFGSGLFMCHNEVGVRFDVFTWTRIVSGHLDEANMIDGLRVLDTLT